jgi:hypothetical protein
MLGSMPPNVFGDDWDVEQTQPGFTWKRGRAHGVNVDLRSRANPTKEAR